MKDIDDINEKHNTLNYESQSSNKRLKNAQIEISKLKYLNKNILDLVYTSNKELFAYISEKLLRLENVDIEKEKKDEGNK